MTIPHTSTATAQVRADATTDQHKVRDDATTARVVFAPPRVADSGNATMTRVGAQWLGCVAAVGVSVFASVVVTGRSVVVVASRSVVVARRSVRGGQQ